MANQLATAYEQSRQPCEAHRVLKEHQRANADSSRRLDVVERVALLEAEGHCGAGGDKTKVPAGKPGKR